MHGHASENPFQFVNEGQCHGLARLGPVVLDRLADVLFRLLAEDDRLCGHDEARTRWRRPLK